MHAFFTYKMHAFMHAFLRKVSHENVLFLLEHNRLPFTFIFVFLPCLFHATFTYFEQHYTQKNIIWSFSDLDYIESMVLVELRSS